MMRPAIVALAFIGTVFTGHAALAGDAAPSPDDAALRACTAYGEGYTLLAGTGTCVKVEGFVRIDTSVSRGSASGGGTSGGQAPGGPAAPAADIKLHFDN